MSLGFHEISPISRDRRIRLAACAGMLAAYLAAVKNDPFTPFQLAFFAAAAAWSLAFEHRYRKPFFSAPVKIALIVLGSTIFVMFISGAGRGGGADDFANSIARFLFWNAIVFVLSRNKSEYDLWTLGIIELSLYMISGAFVQPPLFLPLLVISVASLLYTFQRSAILRCGVAGETGKGGLGLSLVTLLVALEGAALVFLFFPRQSFRAEKPPTEILSRDKGGATAPSPLPPLSGADRVGMPRNPEQLDLASLDKLKSDHRQVLTLRVRDEKGRLVPPEQTLYLRGAVLDRYQDGRWSAAFQKLLKRDADDGRVDGWTELEPKPPPKRKILRQQITTSAIAGDLSFAIPDPIRIGLKEARYDPAGMVFFSALPRELVQYSVDSALMPLDPPRLGSPPVAREAYLQVSPGLDQLRAIAAKQTQGLGSHQLHSKADLLTRYLMRNGFTYKLGPFIPADGRDAVEYFLDKREGYCTHYATALTLLCRAAGVPARIATGFRLHDPDEEGTFRVRNSDAHAWTEVWFGPDHGWRAYDATPSTGNGPNDAPPPDPASGLAKKEEEPKEAPRRWDDFIVNFDTKSQSRAIVSGLEAGVRALGALATFVLSPLAAVLLAALSGLGLGLYLLLPKRRRRRLRQILGGFHETTTVDFYRDFLWALSRLGIHKPATQTAREFARDVSGRLSAPGIDFVTEKFYESRYGGGTLDPGDRARIDQVVSMLLTLRSAESPKPVS